jgi:hypothetical protein
VNLAKNLAKNTFLKALVLNTESLVVLREFG